MRTSKDQLAMPIYPGQKSREVESRFKIENEKGELKIIERKASLYVSENSKISFSASKMKKAEQKIYFGPARLFDRKMDQFIH